MKQPWFKKARWPYLRHAIGMLFTIGALVCMVAVCRAVFRNGHSISDDSYEIFVYATCIPFWWAWIAEKTS